MDEADCLSCRWDTRNGSFGCEILFDQKPGWCNNFQLIDTPETRKIYHPEIFKKYGLSPYPDKETNH